MHSHSVQRRSLTCLHETHLNHDGFYLCYAFLKFHLVRTWKLCPPLPYCLPVSQSTYFLFLSILSFSLAFIESECRVSLLTFFSAWKLSTAAGSTAGSEICAMDSLGALTVWVGSFSSSQTAGSQFASALVFNPELRYIFLFAVPQTKLCQVIGYLNGCDGYERYYKTYRKLSRIRSLILIHDSAKSSVTTNIRASLLLFSCSGSLVGRKFRVLLWKPGHVIRIFAAKIFTTTKRDWFQ